jgi:monovalent cation:H+ antiporter-2, CPA2 family
MHLDPMMPKIVAAAFVVLLIGLFLRRYRQPHVVVYLIAGALIGPQGMALLPDVATATRIGDVGVVLLLFFVGMEVSLPRLVSNWRVAIVGTLAQILATVAVVMGVGWLLGWPLSRSVLLGFVVCLSSTAVVVSMLREWGKMDTQLGHDALGVLLVQDLAVVPMLLVIGLLADEPTTATTIGLQVVGGVVIIGIVGFIFRRGSISLPFARLLKADHELQVFSAFVLCFGLATVTALAHLSTALGAFVAGIIVASASETEWVHRSLEPLRVLLVALFFVSVGMLIDFGFLLENWYLVAGFVATVLVLNTFLTASVLKVLGRSWRQAIYTGALLAQVGEFSFVLAAVGYKQGLISEYGYQLAVALIVMTLVSSPGWVAGARLATGNKNPAV